MHITSFNFSCIKRNQKEKWEKQKERKNQKAQQIALKLNGQIIEKEDTDHTLESLSLSLSLEWNQVK